MYIDKSNLTELESSKIDRLVKEAFQVLRKLIRIDESEEVYFYVNDDFTNGFGRSLCLVGFRGEDELDELIDKNDIIFKICNSYETLIELNRNHLNFDEEEEVINTIIHELLHHLTNNEEEEHGVQWTDLAKYISRNTKYQIQEAGSVTATLNHMKGFDI